MSSHNHVVSVRDAERHFGGLRVFTELSFDVAAGQCCAIVGANGAGKSTLLRCMVGAERLDHGSITVDGDPVDESSPGFRAAVAAVIGDVAVFAHLTAHEHLQLVATAHGVPDPYGQASRVLEDVGLLDAADQLPVTMSSGQRRDSAWHRHSFGRVDYWCSMSPNSTSTSVDGPGCPMRFATRLARAPRCCWHPTMLRWWIPSQT